MPRLEPLTGWLRRWSWAESWTARNTTKGLMFGHNHHDHHNHDNGDRISWSPPPSSKCSPPRQWMTTVMTEMTRFVWRSTLELSKGCTWWWWWQWWQRWQQQHWREQWKRFAGLWESASLSWLKAGLPWAIFTQCVLSCRFSCSYVGSAKDKRLSKSSMFHHCRYQGILRPGSLGLRSPRSQP